MIHLSHFNKFRAQATNGYASKKEYLRSLVLKNDLKTGEIKSLDEQVVFKLYGEHGHHICNYRADFVYLEKDKKIIEDVKGFQTRDFKLKWKLLADKFSAEIENGKIELRLT